MKKTLAAVAVLGAFAGSALAADVQLYGIVDTGLRYLSSDMDASFAGVGQESTDQFSMESGMASGSRWGIKGTEDLGNGYPSASFLKISSILIPVRTTTTITSSVVSRLSSLRAASVSLLWVVSAP